MTTNFLLGLSLSLLVQNCQTESESLPASLTAGNDFRTELSKGKDVYVDNQTIADELDFTGLVPAYTMAPGSRRATIAGAVTFYKCRFKKPVTAYHSDKNGVVTAVNFAKNLTFIDCVFDSELNLRACSVQDLACFSKCIFSGKVNFEESDFANYAIFSNSLFDAETRFQNTFFRKKADFFRTEFNQSVNFQGANFALEAQFNAAKSFKSADFSTAVFHSHSFFNYAEWHGQVFFNDAWFKGRCEFLEAKFETGSFKNCWFLGKPKFNQAAIDISLDLDGCHWAAEKPDLGSLDSRKILNYKE